MLTAAALIFTAVLACALAVMVTVYRGSLDHITQLEDVVRAKCAELDALSIAGPPATAVAALTPDDPSLLPAEIEQWLRERTN